MVVLIQPFSYHLVERKEGKKKRLNNHGRRGGGGDDDEYMTSTVCMHLSIYLPPHSQPADKVSSSIGASGVAVVCEQVSDCIYVIRYIQSVTHLYTNNSSTTCTDTTRHQ
jgi:hypothetical protein